MGWTGPPCSVGCPTTDAPGQPNAFPRFWQLAGPPAGSITDDDRRQPANNTSPLGGPVILLWAVHLSTGFELWVCYAWRQTHNYHHNRKASMPFSQWQITHVLLGERMTVCKQPGHPQSVTFLKSTSNE